MISGLEVVMAVEEEKISKEQLVVVMVEDQSVTTGRPLLWRPGRQHRETL